MATKHSVQYTQNILSDRWKEVSLITKRLRDFRCEVCGRKLPTYKLAAHHFKGYSMMGHETPDDLQVLCQFSPWWSFSPGGCHQKIHPRSLGWWFRLNHFVSRVVNWTIVFFIAICALAVLTVAWPHQ